MTMEAAATVEAKAPVRGWALPTRIAFRFFSVYFGIYVLSTFILRGLIAPNAEIPSLGELGPLRMMVEWAAARVFAVTEPLVVSGSGSGDKMFDWAQVFCFLVIAAVVTVVWSFAARKRESHVRFHTWFRLFLRFALGSALISYGMVKAIPLQMPYPSLMRLVEPFGHFSPMGVLWSSIGVSRPYEIFTGCAELTAGILLIIPSTVTLGALVSLACATQVFILNMAYDVPVKLSSFHLILMSLFLLAPMETKSLTLSKPNDPKWTATFSFQQPAADRMILQGDMDGKKVQMRLELFPREKFRLVSRGFNWIQEFPFNQ